MAFEDVYAETLSTSLVSGIYDESNASYLRVLESLLPPGAAWTFDVASNMLGLLEGMSYSFLRVHQRAKVLLEEFDPRTTFELLADWERVLDLPGTDPNPATTLADRRDAVHGLLLGHGDPERSIFEAIVTGLGYTPTITHKTHNQFVPVSVAGDPLTQSDWMFVWYIAVLGTTNDVTLKYVINKLVPSHTRVIYKIAAATWVSRASQFVTANITDFVWGNDLFVATGSTGKLSTSPDGVTWTARTSQFTATIINASVNGLGIFVIVGGAGKLASSVDGITWVARTSQFGANEIKTVIHKNGLFVAAGAAGDISTSPDGETWTARTAAGAYAGNFLHAIFARELYILGGTIGEIQTSPDGITWTARTSTMGALEVRKFAYGNGTIVAVGDFGKLASSTDGITWTARTSQFGITPIKSVLWAGSLFVAVGNTGKIATSTDGVIWVLQTGPFGTSTIHDVTHYDGLFVAVSDGGVAVSYDAVTWTLRTSGFGADFVFTALGLNNLLLIGGANGKLSSTPYGEV